MSRSDLKKRKKILSDLITKDKSYTPMRKREIAVLLGIPKEDEGRLTEALESLIHDGVISVSHGRYGKREQRDFTGTFLANRRGFGFVRPNDGSEDIFIPRDATGGAFHMDTVQGRITSLASGSRKKEGEVTTITGHGITHIAGTFEKRSKTACVVPDNTSIPVEIIIPEKEENGAANGDKVVAQITAYGADDGRAKGKIAEIIGSQDTPGADITSLVMAYDIPSVFPDEVLKQARALPKRVYPRDMKGRDDFRELLTITVDGPHTKDFDDAVSLTMENGIYHLGVHIADVSHYVPEGSPLDLEALNRGTSCYLPDRVIPMLPVELSNGICSLNEQRNRLTLSCMMDFDEDGNRVSARICKSVIRTAHRMIYGDVQKIFDGDEKTRQKYADVAPMLDNMHRLAHRLFDRRKKRGMIDFDFPEAEIVLKKNGKPKEILLRERTDATQMIEEFMLAANETVAEEFCRRKIPFLYRRHGRPDSEKIQELKRVTAAFGFTLQGDPADISPMQIQNLLTLIEGSDAQDMISTLVLRSMQRADYGPQCLGHFGLASRYYCHFTSPIRRYPDLQIHRIITESLDGTLNDERKDHYNSILAGVGTKTSACERRADELEREGDQLKMCEFMQEHIGEEYDGKVSGITGWGIYVRLANSVEGMISVSSLPGYYIYDESHYCMRRSDGRRQFTFGQKVKVRVVASDPITRNIDFELTEEEEIQTGTAPEERRADRHSGGRHSGHRKDKKSGGSPQKQKDKKHEFQVKRHGRKRNRRKNSGK
ncbi:MAG: ribonuclease R [Lachnospiraceae bacterium]|jgi:ribonuclease R|nr:ribonuclease R [Lachnospiraceae bacterium]MCH4069756.1 ribonuclease R [Lachnospiraceae bacterium]MCH4107305.1 ribonuclease R [Lachnospiraceae bacterium]MCI1362045.1 ribonuclease R [Lachnospiraceae bacterium]MCI1381495.1 ribonuclease R [Lachnospiraceae bacterium]